MKVEVRADNSVHIEGYVNVCERESRPVVTPRGKVNEIIETRAFANALEKNEVELKVDHNRVIGSTKDNLTLYEDNIGLRADLTTDDEEVVENAKNGTIKGWSFGFQKPIDTVEERADKYPLRRISDLTLNEVSLIINQNPVYSATSVEVRAGEECDIETRSTYTTVEVTDRVSVSEHDDGVVVTDTEHVEVTRTETIDYSNYEERLNAIKGEL